MLRRACNVLVVPPASLPSLPLPPRPLPPSFFLVPSFGLSWCGCLCGAPSSRGAGLVVGRMGGGRGGAQSPSLAPLTPTLSGTWKCKPPLPPHLLLVGRRASWEWRRAPAGARPGGARGCVVPVVSAEMLWAQPCRPLCSALICSVPSLVWFSVSLLSFPHPILWPPCRFSGPRAPPPPLWVCVGGSPRPVLITALFLIDLSYLGSVVETSLSSAQ